MQSLLRAGQIGSKHKIRDINFMCVRTLFTREELGVYHFENLRKQAIEKFTSPASIDQYKQNIISNFNNMSVDVQRNSIKEYIYLSDGKTEELTTLKTFLIEYTNNYSNRDLTLYKNVKDFIFGTQILRLLYFFNLPDQAIKWFKDIELKDNFHQMQTYKILLDLLYKNKRYDEVINLYKEIKFRLDAYEMFPDITVNCLVFAACYSKNTAEHYEYARNLWKDLKNYKQLHRTSYLLAGLAIKQDDPKFALSLVDSKRFYVTERFIRFIAHTKLGEFDKSCDLLRDALRIYKTKANTHKPSFGKQMVDDLRQSIENSGSTEQLNDFVTIHKNLISHDLLSDETLDGHLCSNFPPMLPRNQYLKMKNKTVKEIC